MTEKSLRKRALIACVLCALGLASCNRQSAQTAPPYTPGFGEIMTLTQRRHIKLWFAGQSGNWPLASYELDELNEGFDDLATYHPTHKDAQLPIPQLIEKMIKFPISQLDEAVKAKDSDRF